jgi:hypothetical protein
MISKIRQWYTRNYEAITWFLIGFLVSGAFADLGRGNTTGALVLFGIAAINYVFVKRK